MESSCESFIESMERELNEAEREDEIVQLKNRIFKQSKISQVEIQNLKSQLGKLRNFNF